MKRNIQILASALIASISVTSLWLAFADDDLTTSTIKSKHLEQLTDEQKTELDSIKTKLESWETLTEEEQLLLDTYKWNKKWKNKWMWWKGWFINDLTDEEKALFDEMTDEEKKEFLDTKREEHKILMESYNSVIDKLLAWEELTTEEENLRSEIIEYRATHNKMK